MEITKFDMTVLIVMSLAVVSISFVFPALGLSDTDTSESDIPELNIGEDRFDIAGDAPDFPATPTSGTLWFNTTKGATFSENSVWLDGDTSGGTEVVMLDDGEVIATRWNSSGEVAEQDSVNISSSSDRGTLSVGEYELALEGASDYSAERPSVDWRADATPRTGGSFVGRLPLVGGIFEAASDTAGVVAWGITILLWFCTFLVEFSLNAVRMLYEITAYLIGTIVWLSGTYASVITAADSWVSIFVALPGILLSTILAKMVAVGVSLLPTT